MNKAGRISPSESSVEPILHQGLNTKHLSEGEQARFGGKCGEFDRDLFSPPTDLDPETRQNFMDAAKILCVGCPVIVRCLDYGLDNVQEPGVWGGLDEADREEFGWKDENDIGRKAVIWSNRPSQND